MMCSRLLKPESKEHGWLYRFFERGFDGLLKLYEAGLKIVLRHRFITLTTMLGTIALTGYLYGADSQGFLSPAGHRIDHRPVGGGAGYLLPSHGQAPASLDQQASSMRAAKDGIIASTVLGEARRVVQVMFVLSA
jgi:hypothetical protein